jgi:hypothetical protein
MPAMTPGPSDSGPEPTPESQPTPEGQRAAEGQPTDGLDGVQFTFAPGSQVDGVELSGLVPPEMLPGGASAGQVSADGLDWQTLMEALAAGGKIGSDPEGLEERAAEREGRMGPADPAVVAAIAVEHMPPGQALAGWLEVAFQAAPRLNEDQLTGVAIAAGTQAAHAHAVRLGAVAQLTARAAAADPAAGLQADGRPARVTRDAAGQLEMALRLSHDGAQAMADLAITLTWRLPDTGALLTTGWIDPDRAKLIAQYTSPLSQDNARQVEAVILPRARAMTCAQLRQRLALLAVAVDPKGAEERRKMAERHADVRLYGDEDLTATLVASKLPQVLAAAGYGKINAMARARKKAGLPGTMGQHRAHVLFELILQTLGLIPPADGDPPDQPPPTDDTPPGDTPPPHEPRPPSQPPTGDRPTGGDSGPGGSARHRPCPDGGPGECGPRDDLPAPRDEDAPEDDGLDDSADTDPDHGFDPLEADDDLDGTGPQPAWPKLGTIPAALARSDRTDSGSPPAGLLDVTLPWTSYAGISDLPATLGRLGAITAEQARQLARAAEHDPAAQWRIIVTDRDGHAIGVTRIRRHFGRDGPPAGNRDRPGACRASPRAAAGLVARVTLIISQDTTTGYPPAATTGRIAVAALKAAARTLHRAHVHAQAASAGGGCAHTAASSAYRPPPRLREYVIARDVTCRNPVCGQPAWRADLDHTRPYDKGGVTCSCNLGGACRRDHQLKQHPRWKLAQIRPGWFLWTAPSGRTYEVGPQSYLC